MSHQIGRRKFHAIGAVGLLALVALHAGSGSTYAHETAPIRVREIVRVQGWVGAEPPQAAKDAVVRTADLTVLGESRLLHAIEWRTFRLDEVPDPPPAAPTTTFTLQGSRQLLRRVRDVRTDQRVTVLAERRPGSRDLFLLAVDLCPAEH
jgi:hypothetical protein